MYDLFSILTRETFLKLIMCHLIQDSNLNNALSERAKAFWEKEDIDDVFDVVFGYLNHLKRVLKKNTATDKGLTLSVFQGYQNV